MLYDDESKVKAFEVLCKEKENISIVTIMKELRAKQVLSKILGLENKYPKF